MEFLEPVWEQLWWIGPLLYGHCKCHRLGP